MRTSDDPIAPYAHQLASLWAAKGRANVKVACPACSPSRRKSREPCLSIRVEGGTLLYQCHHCGIRGRTPLQQDHTPMPQHTAISVARHVAAPTAAVWGWLESRGLRRQELEQALGQETHMAVGSLPGKDVAAFPMYDRHGALVNVQYRSLREKRFKMVPGQPLTFYLAHALGRKDTLVITEGQLDALSVIVSADAYDVVSLPNGTNNLSFDPDAWAFLAQHYSGVVLATDGDEPGRACAAKIAKRIGYHKVRTVAWPEGCKDANDVLMRHGKDMLCKVLDSAMAPPVEGTLTLDDMAKAVVDIIHSWPQDERATTGIESFDEMVRFARGEIVLITGIPGHGKSTFIDQIAVGLAKTSGWKTAFLSFEKYNHAHHAAELMEKFLKKPVVGAWSETFAKVAGTKPPSVEEIEKAYAFVNKHFVFFDVTDTASDGIYKIDTIVDRLVGVHHRHNIDMFVLDNLSFVKREERNENDSVNAILNQLILAAKRYDICIVVVAHPRKPESGTGANYVPQGYSVAGTANLYNKVDIGLTIHRDYETDTTTVYAWKRRSRFCGDPKVKDVSFAFDHTSAIFIETF